MKIFGDTTKEVFIEQIKIGKIKNIIFVSYFEIEEFWETLSTSKNITEFSFTISDYKQDLEVRLPKLIEKNPGLTKIILYYKREIDEFNTEFLSQSLQNHKIGLEKFYIYHLDISKRRGEKDEFCLTSLFKCFEKSYISYLELEKVILNDLSLESIGKIKNLEILRLFNWDLSSKIELNHSINVQALSIYDYNNCESPNYDLTYKLIELFPCLQELNLYLYKCVMDYKKLKDALGKNVLKRFLIGNIEDHINEEHMEDLFSMVSEEIAFIDLSQKLKDFPYFSKLKNNNSIKKLDNIYKIENFKDLDVFLSNNQKISSLTLVLNNETSSESQLKIISKGIFNNHSLENLKIQMNLKQHFNEYFCEILTSKKIHTLDLSHCNLDNDDCTSISQYISNTNSLTDLNISSNKITKDALFYIGRGLLKNKSLKSISLANNELTMKDLKQFKTDLFYNYNLKHIDLEDEEINFIMQRNRNFIETLIVSFKLLDVKFNFH